jgi:hypothetical protein
VRKHIKLLMKIFFNEWRDLYGYHVNISIDEESIKEIVDMLSFLFCTFQKSGSLHLPTRFFFSFNFYLFIYLLTIVL